MTHFHRKSTGNQGDTLTRKAKRSSAANRDGSGLLGSVFGRRAFAIRGASSEAKGSSAPSGRFYLGFIALAAAIFLLIPSAQAMAEGTVKLHIVGTGTGEVTSGLEDGGETLAPGEPPMECSGPPESGTCENEMEVFEEGFEAEALNAIADPGSEFVEWTFQEGGSLLGEPCTEPTCIVGHFGTGGEGVEITATFATGPKEFKFKVAKSGSGTGTVECEVEGGPAAPCPETDTKYPEGTEIVLTATEAEGSTFTGFSGGGCSTSPCTLTLEANTTVTATFEQFPPTVENNPPGTVTSSTAVLNGHVDNEGAAAGSACFFEVALAGDPTFSSPVTAPACAPNPVTGTASAAVSATATGLNPATDYIYRVVATNAGGTSKASPAEPFATLVGPPLISEERATSVTATSATLNAKVNPSGLATSYHFEWGADASYSHRIPAEFDLFVGSGTSPIKVTASLTGLQEATAYHFRLVTNNSQSPPGETLGPDQEFGTLNAAGLPDNRAAELVSPADKRPQGTVAGFPLPGDEQQFGFVAAPDGDSVLFPILSGLGDATAGGFPRYLATRGEAGWQSSQVSAPSLVPGNGREPGLVRYASPDLSCELVESVNPLTADTPAADVELSVVNLYRRNADGSYDLLTDRVPRNPFAELGAEGKSYYDSVAASAGCGRVFFRAPYRFLPAASSGLYEWDSGTLRDAGLLPDGAAALTPMIGGLLPHETRSYSAVNAVSPSGRLFFNATSDQGGDAGQRAVFVRKGPGAVVDASQKQGGAKENHGATYQTASPDGSHLFFTANYGLTGAPGIGWPTSCTFSGSGAQGLNGEGCDLYDYDVDAETLTDLSADANPADSKGAEVHGVAAVSDTGSYVYFAAGGQLVPGQGNTYAQNHAGAGAVNIYLAHGGALAYVATIRASDLVRNDVCAGGNAKGCSGGNLMIQAVGRSSQATPDGRHLLFTSTANVTGYPAGLVAQAYLYSAESESTVCVSCRPDGQPSLGNVQTEPIRSALTNVEEHNRIPRSLSDDGSRAFFTMPDVLAPGAVAGKANLYEWERGQVYLLGVFDNPFFGGTTNEGFVDASASGDDVFLVTPKQLNRYDFDTVYDLYDLRVDGGFPEPPLPPVPCDPAADRCQGTPAEAPGASSSANADFSGPGNPPAPRPRCPKGKVRRHGKCVAKKHHRKKHHQRAGHNHGGAK
jgi:Divergent InlB B-repeat domain